MSDAHGDPAEMKSAKLAMMANQIASFFQSYPEDRAVAGVAQHIRKFWTPNMRQHLHDQATHGDARLHALVVKAMTQPVDPKKSPGREHAVGDLAYADAG